MIYSETAINDYCSMNLCMCIYTYKERDCADRKMAQEINHHYPEIQQEIPPCLCNPIRLRVVNHKLLVRVACHSHVWTQHSLYPH